MKGIFLTFLVCIFFLNGQTQYLTPAEKNEPKNNFELTINGKKYNISEDEDLKLDSLVYNPTISVKLAQYKKFKNLSISFDYPRNLSFEFEQDLKNSLSTK